MFGLTTTRKLRAAQERIADLRALLDAEEAGRKKDQDANFEAIIEKDTALTKAGWDKQVLVDEVRRLKAAELARRDQADRHNTSQTEMRRKLEADLAKSEADVVQAAKRIRELERTLQQFLDARTI